MKSAVIFEGQGYTVCWLARSESLIVQRDYAGNDRYKRGVALQGDEAVNWRQSIIEAMDDQERIVLARAIYRDVHV